MAKKKSNNIFDIAFTKRDEEIRQLEFQKFDVEEDLEDAISEFIKLSGKKNLKLRKKRVVKALRDDRNPDKLK